MRKTILLIATLVWAPVAAASEELMLRDYSGKVVLIDFWASWCVPCRRSFPWLNEMHSRYEDDGLVIIAVNLDRTEVEAQRFLQDYPAKFKIVYDPTGVLAKQYDIQGMPSSIVFGRDGQMLDQHSGFKVKRQDDYEATLTSALAEEYTQ